MPLNGARVCALTKNNWLQLVIWGCGWWLGVEGCKPCVHATQLDSMDDALLKTLRCGEDFHALCTPPPEMSITEQVKRCVIGNAPRLPLNNLDGDMHAACRWDCYRRASMLEPMSRAIFQDGVQGDFLEAGVFKGGISTVMATLLALGDPGGARVAWFADSFDGLPNVQTAVGADVDNVVKLENRRIRFWRGRFNASLATVGRHFERCYRDEHGKPARFGGWGRARALPGFFEDSLPGPVRSLALLRVDGDLYSSITTTLERLWPLLNVGGFVVFDDWKFEQARLAIVQFRKRWGVETPVRFANGTLDAMAWWRKE